MSKLSPRDNHANQKNANKGTSGFNKQYLAVQKNRSIQKNPTSRLFKGAKLPPSFCPVLSLSQNLNL